MSGSINPPGTVATVAPVAGSAPSIGSFTISGTAPDKNTIAAFVDALSTVKGVSSPYVSSAQTGTGARLQFSLQLQITSAALSGRFTTPKATPSATGSH